MGGIKIVKEQEIYVSRKTMRELLAAVTQLRVEIIKVMASQEPPVEIEHVGYSPRECGRDQ